ncbi:Cytochrome c biogenesis protein CcdA [Arboricoccus pini]|uniref:Cytochrome c biogenesis protein CcdA n=1 Tax=Arboricoccus pini TaxID=1963835 RepID=A0A212QUG9_9PROT|nr:cytochrome c biogenesis protein DipZ [Arboricoccus pini]SNB63337.1 Cytochrome c biogenesis protein CcdA [Arboricoccus pini]
MLFFVLAYFGGVLTILSPCILPVLPFVFARSDRPFVSSGLPMLIGMALTFAAVATLAAVGGGWVIQANAYGRTLALILLTLFGVTLIFPALSEWLTRPLVDWGSRLSQSGDRHRGASPLLPSLGLGLATGLLWAPCAGPILGLILTGAALHGASVETSLLLATYAAGAATSLALALVIGGRVFKAMKRMLGAGEWIRRGLGAAVIAAVVVVALGLDTSFLTQVSLANTTSVEQMLLDRIRPPLPAQASAPTVGDGNTARTSDTAMTQGASTKQLDDLPVIGTSPALSGAVQWLNSPPLTTDELKGKVVLVDFWTYSCINCLRELPYVRAWAQKYKSQGLVVIGVHAPEFAFERDINNVKKAIDDLKINFPVAVDNDYAIWRAFANEYWPAEYFIDAQGRIRHQQFGEGDYDRSERVIQQLIAETGKGDVPAGIVQVNASGAEAAADMDDVKSPETYVGYRRAENFASENDMIADAPHVYKTADLQLNEWGLAGNWTINGEYAALNQAGGDIVYKFHARDLHLVLGPAPEGRPIRFQITIDGQKPGAAHGADVDAQGEGVVTDQRLYQLVRQSGPVRDHTFEIHFLDAGVQAYAFTFG